MPIASRSKSPRNVSNPRGGRSKTASRQADPPEFAEQKKRKRRMSRALRAQIEAQTVLKTAGFAKLGDEGTILVAERLRGNNIVEDLVLTSCGISGSGALALAESLGEHNNRLKVLELSDNRFLGDDGVQSIAHMLRKNATLEKLCLNGCGVGERGASALFEALKDNTTLRELHLCSNVIGQVGAEAAADMLRWNDSLQTLSLERIFFPFGTSCILFALRDANSTLTGLRLNINEEVESCPETAETLMESLLQENLCVGPNAAEQRARCLLFCCLQLARTAHEHIVPSIGAVPVPVLQRAVEHAGILHVAKRFEPFDVAAGQSSTGVRARSLSSSPDSDRLSRRLA